MLKTFYIDSINSISVYNIEALHRIVALQSGNVFTAPFSTWYAHCLIPKVKLSEIWRKTPHSGKLSRQSPVQNSCIVPLQSVVFRCLQRWHVWGFMIVSHWIVRLRRCEPLTHNVNMEGFVCNTSTMQLTERFYLRWRCWDWALKKSANLIYL